MNKLPIGMQDFKDLRERGFIYVDKTEFIYKLLQSGKPFFLSRPRRFGKSLFLSTLKYYFLGKKELFEGLYITQHETEWTEYPVFHIDFNVENYSGNNGITAVNNAIDSNLRVIEEQFGISIESNSVSSRFKDCIRKVSEKTGKNVVVLIDEYDKPLISALESTGEINEEIKNVLKGFYGVLKSSDQYLRLAFLTGVTKFSKVSVFSDLNQLQDISMTEKYAEICGISERELQACFKENIQALAEKNNLSYESAIAEMKKRYDGYHFAETSADMYNPFSVLNTLEKNKFGNYWYETGTPTFLVKVIQRQDLNLKRLKNNIRIRGDNIFSYRAGNDDITSLLYQSGYLTIKSYDRALEEYILGFPNDEVKYGFLNDLMRVYVPEYGRDGGLSARRFVQDLMEGRIEDFLRRLQSFYKNIPYDITERKERYFQRIFWSLLTLAGQFVTVEQRTADGRIDAVVETEKYTYVFEFKIDDKATAKDALAQIDSKDYLLPFAFNGKEMVKVGVVFGAEDRQVKEWVVG
jgi:hypothetical protein